MSIARLSAGTGYRYLLKNIARGDGAEPEHTGGSLAAYYAASGYPPGVWLGRGLAGVGGGAGLVAGSAVSEEQMGRLFGAGRDPVTGQALGRPYRTPAGGPNVKASVAGFDLTFSVPKSVSVLWALADEPTRNLIVAAHHDAVAQVLAVAERDVIRTRVGHAGLAQVETRGVIAAGFDHYDSRAGDPQLHTHLTLANRLQGPDARWRTLYSRRLFQAAVALSETYDALLADHITGSLGLGWEWRQRGPGRNPARELAAVPPELVTEFSKRSAAIDTAKDAAIATFTQTHGRAPTAAETLKIRQRVTLSTRDPKHTQSLADYTAAWRERAAAVLGQDPSAWAQQVTEKHTHVRMRTAEDVTAGDVEVLAAAVLDGVELRRSTWSRWNLQAEACRAMTARGLQFSTPADLLVVRDRVTAAAVDRSVLLNTPAVAAVPERWRDSVDGRSVFAFPETYTSTRILAAEDRLLVCAEDTTGPVAVAPAATPAAAVTANANAVGEEGQRAVVAQICSSGRVCDVLIGPAGAGKSTAMGALRHAWEASHGGGSVTALAPSAAAARVLAREIGASAETTAQWIAQQAGTDRRLQRLADLQRRRDRRAAAGIPAGDLDDAIATAVREFDRWRLRPGQLLIVDEASMCDTHTLDALAAQAKTAQAKVLLVGDPSQLAAVGPGGAFTMLTHARPDTPELTAVHRFREPDGAIRTWEAHASIALRRGDATALDTYTSHDRIHDGGNRDAALDAAYQAWRADQQRGLSSLLIAVDNDTVTALNRKAHDDLAAAGRVTADEGVTLADGTVASVGDRIVTRRVDRHLPDGTTSPRRTPSGALTAGYVTNGAAFTVTDINPDGSVTVRADRGRPVTLPATYVAEHVQLGYAVTAHRAQGATVDTAHLVAAPGMTREALYVALTRGRLANHAHVTTTDTDRGDVDRLQNHPPQTAREVLTGILASTGQPASAHQTISDLQAKATRPGQVWGEYQTIAADAHRRRIQQLLATPDPRASALARISTTGDAAGPGLDDLVAAVRYGDAYGLDANRLLPTIAATSTDLDEITNRYAGHAAAAARARHYRPVVPLVPGTSTPSAVNGITDPDTRTALLDREHLLAAAQQAAGITTPAAATPVMPRSDRAPAPDVPEPTRSAAAQSGIQRQMHVSYPGRHEAQRTRANGVSR
jgi:conjugative relaxase-like TrwC/TraI family protein